MTDFVNPITGSQEADLNQVLQSAAVAPGNGSNMFVRNQVSALLKVSGVTTASIVIEGTSDGSTWATIGVTNIVTGAAANAISANGTYSINFVGLLNVRARIDTYSAGTINIVGVTKEYTAAAGSSGGGGAATVADGADVTQGAVADAAVITDVAGTVSAKLRGIVKLLATGITVTIPALLAGENHVGEVGGKTVRSTVEFTRTTGTTGYHANDIVLPATPALVEIPNAARVSGGSGYITEIRVSTNVKSIVPRFRIHFFNAANPTISADGAVWQDKYADVAKRVGYWDMPALSTAADATNSDMSRSMDASMRLPFVCVAGTSLYYAIETLDAFTPADSQKFSISLYCEQN